MPDSQFTIREPHEVSYREVGIVVPVAYGETPGVYCACLYLNTPAGVVAGREIQGFPKKDAQITVTEEGGEVSTIVRRYGFPLIKATMCPETRVELIPESPTGSSFTSR
jgi:acetoacetate decarboxylase